MRLVVSYWHSESLKHSLLDLPLHLPCPMLKLLLFCRGAGAGRGVGLGAFGVAAVVATSGRERHKKKVHSNHHD